MKAKLNNNPVIKESKPKPPLDLWEQLNADLTAIGKPPFEVTDKCFTHKQFCSKFKINSTMAYARLQELQKLGKIKKLGRISLETYYERIVD